MDITVQRMGMSILKQILDACCGSKMFWFNKDNPSAVFMDNRTLETNLCDGRILKIAPDIVADFKDIPFPDNKFKLVVFDPPHLIHAGEKSWMRAKYGCLEKRTWKDDIQRGFSECMRVLEPGGVLIFKWNEEQIKLKELLAALDKEPLFGDKRSKTHWLVFMKFD